jgi:hypothetical protein
MKDKHNKQWSLLFFNFVINHRLNKTNLINVLFKHFNYCKAISENVKRLLLILKADGY